MDYMGQRQSKYELHNRELEGMPMALHRKRNSRRDAT